MYLSERYKSTVKKKKKRKEKLALWTLKVKSLSPRKVGGTLWFPFLF